MNYIEIDLSKPESLNNYDRVAGRQGEANTRGVRFIVPPEYLEWALFAETENANGEARKYSIKDIQDNIAVYKFRKKDLEAKGRLLLDLVLEKGDMVFKPFSGEFAVKFAICATDDGFEDVEVDLTGYALKADIPRNVSELKNDAGYISAKELDNAVSNVLEEAKASGAFDGKDGVPGQNGNDGLSAYQIWINAGNTGTEADFLASLKGANGENGKDGLNGKDGKDGYTPIKGVDYFDGEKGDPFTYDDFTPEQLEALRGEAGYTPVKGVDYFDGEKGEDGADGYTPIKGTDYFTEADKVELVNSVLNSLPTWSGGAY